jgi:cyclopropane-fatty-acyl-phospholipid synthase
MALNSTLHLDSCVNINRHYAETLRLWRLRFNANAAKVRALGFDVEFERIWNLYLCMCEASFLHSTINLQQITFSRTSNANLFRKSLSCPTPQAQAPLFLIA